MKTEIRINEHGNLEVFQYTGERDSRSVLEINPRDLRAIGYLERDTRTGAPYIYIELADTHKGIPLAFDTSFDAVEAKGIFDVLSFHLGQRSG